MSLLGCVNRKEYKSGKQVALQQAAMSSHSSTSLVVAAPDLFGALRSLSAA